MSPTVNLRKCTNLLGGKIPFHNCRKDGGLIEFAGLYDIWKPPDGKELKTFAILTAAPNEFMTQVHNRMPVILAPEQEATGRTTEPDTDPLVQYAGCV